MAGSRIKGITVESGGDTTKLLSDAVSETKDKSTLPLSRSAPTAGKHLIQDTYLHTS